MNAPDAIDWPAENKRLASAAEVHAFGYISLIFNYLESTAGHLFGHYLPMSVSVCDSIYHRLNNADRIFLLHQIIEENERDSAVKDAVSYYLNCYDICTENRNTLVHASIEVRDSPDMLPISKRSKAAKEILFHLSLGELRSVADQMGNVFDYGTRLLMWLFQRNNPTDERAKLMGWSLPPTQPSLPDKPSKPRKLIPVPAPASRPA
jgi:hypothetical protein